MLSFLHSFNRKGVTQLLTFVSLKESRESTKSKQIVDQPTRETFLWERGAPRYLESPNKRNSPLGKEKADHCGNYVNGTSKDKRPVITDER